MADIFDEVADDLRADRAKRLAAKYGVWLLFAVLLLVAGIAGWQAWRWNQSRQSSLVAGTYLSAMREAASPEGSPDRTAAAAELARLAETAPDGYRTLARLRLAALRADTNDTAGALALWDQLSADTGADPLLRELANLLWVQHSVDAGDPAAVEARLQPLLAQTNPWRALAQESEALLALRLGRTDQARDLFRRLSVDPSASDGVRARATGLLARLGEAPAAGAGG